MSDDGELPKRRTSRYPKRERVTLKWDSPPLLLPGEEEGAAGGDDVDLELPREGEGAGDENVPTIPPPGESPIGADGWERQKAKLTPAPFRPPTEPPPPLVENENGGALDLVERSSRSSSPGAIDLVSEMGDRHALGDFTAALRIAELILGREPEHDVAARIAESSRERLGQLYGSRLGSLERIPYVAVQMHEVRWLGLDHRAAFLLSRIDGTQTIQEILDVSGMPKLEALKMLVELLDMAAIGFRD
jgi:hypothetical protein